jgi:transposase, IS5 family
MKQRTLAGFEKYGKVTRRAQFLADMERVMPWDKLMGLIRPHYPTMGEQGGRPPIPLERMLRVYCLQLWFNLSDPGVEEALYDSDTMRRFVGVELGSEAPPDETTVCKFRHLLEQHDMSERVLKVVNRHLASRGLKVSNGTIVDATIIEAPSSTKNQDGDRDPEMHQVKKGEQWYFGMKMHVGVDSCTKIIHTVQVSAANVADKEALPHLLHGKERRVWGDQAYRGQGEVLARVAPMAQDLTNQAFRRNGRIDERIREANRLKSKVRARVEHVFGTIKRVFGFRKVRFRGLFKNRHHVRMLAALANLFTLRRRLLAT